MLVRNNYYDHVMKQTGELFCFCWGGGGGVKFFLSFFHLSFFSFSLFAIELWIKTLI